MTVPEPVGVEDRLRLFSWVFQNDLQSLQGFLQDFLDKSPPSSQEDNRLYHLSTLQLGGQTLMTLSLSLGHHSITACLVQSGLSCLTRNGLGWSPYQEAVSYGHRPTLSLLYSKRRQELLSRMNHQGKAWIQGLEGKTGDFEGELKWAFESRVPYLKDLCPEVRVSLMSVAPT
jgi:hypothetical protein